LVILDVDLDFFDSSIRYRRSDDARPTNSGASWPTEQVRRFLEEECGLSSDSPIPGRRVTQHHEAFLFWKELIDSGRLATPFELDRVDAHEDLGAGEGDVMTYISTQLVKLHPEERAEEGMIRVHG